MLGCLLYACCTGPVLIFALPGLQHDLVRECKKKDSPSSKTPLNCLWESPSRRRFWGHVWPVECRAAIKIIPLQSSSAHSLSTRLDVPPIAFAHGLKLMDRYVSIIQSTRVKDPLRCAMKRHELQLAIVAAAVGVGQLLAPWSSVRRSVTAMLLARTLPISVTMSAVCTVHVHRLGVRRMVSHRRSMPSLWMESRRTSLLGSQWMEVSTEHVVG